jgi:hypothetical protein
MKKLLPCLLTALACVSMPSKADFPRSEVLLNGMQATLKAGSGTAISGTAGYNYSVTPYIQIGVSGDVLYTNVANISGTTFDVLGALTFNIPISGRDSDMQNAFFLDAKGGIEIQSIGLLSPTYFILEATAGKRFEILQGVCYRPEIGVQDVNGSWAFLVRALSFSFMF